jgi:hypothetical protein
MLAISTLLRAYRAMPPVGGPQAQGAPHLSADAARIFGRTPSSEQE